MAFTEKLLNLPKNNVVKVIEVKKNDTVLLLEIKDQILLNSYCHGRNYKEIKEAQSQLHVVKVAVFLLLALQLYVFLQ